MVETIAPVVYGRKRGYWGAVALHAGAAAVAGAAFTTLLAMIGMIARAPWGTAGAMGVGALGIAYAAREILGLSLPLFDRKQQVPDWWRTFYSPHVAATLYGAGLGIGFLTFLRFGTYVVVSAMAFASGDWRVGALLGGTFGLSRGLTTVMSASSRDEVEASNIVTKLERTASGKTPRLVNGLILLVVAVTGLVTACDSTTPTAERVPSPGASQGASSLDARGPRRFSPARVLGRLRDPRIEESSGLVASRSQPGVLWTHNDSGDGPHLYALDMRGRSLGKWSVTGAEALDWEDMALLPSGLGDFIYIGDIGDNGSTRSSVTVYRVAEPDATQRGGLTERAKAITLRYPDRPHDAEALLVHPETGDLYIVTKQFSGRAVVYRADAPLAAETRLSRVRRLNLPSALGGVTSGSISPTGDRLVLATYSGALEFTLQDPSSGFDSIWDEDPTIISIGDRAQGEAISYDAAGAALLATSEGRRSPLLIVETAPD